MRRQRAEVNGEHIAFHHFHLKVCDKSLPQLPRKQRVHLDRDQPRRALRKQGCNRSLARPDLDNNAPAGRPQSLGDPQLRLLIHQKVLAQLRFALCFVLHGLFIGAYSRLRITDACQRLPLD